MEMARYGGARKFLPISNVSMLGTCETRYADAIFGRLWGIPIVWAAGSTEVLEAIRVATANADEYMLA